MGHFSQNQHNSQRGNTNQRVDPGNFLKKPDSGHQIGNEQGNNQGNQNDNVLPDCFLEGQSGNNAESGSQKHAHHIQNRCMNILVYHRHHNKYIKKDILHFSADEGQIQEKQ